jgi:hypothetical protein
LPSNSIIDIRKFALAFKLSVSGGEQTRLASVNSIIERISITIGGTEISSGFNKYNVLHQLKKVLMEENTCPLTEHPDIVREKNLTTGVAFADGGGEEADYRIDNWLSFLGECEPRILDTSKMAAIQISITLASPQAVCIQSALNDSVANFQTAATATDATYALSGIYATIPILSFADGMYDGMTNAMMSRQGFLEIPYKNYINLSDVGSSVRWNCASASIDRIWTASRDANYNTSKLPVLVEGY